jgi:hypothetical protein
MGIFFSFDSEFSIGRFVGLGFISANLIRLGIVQRSLGGNINLLMMQLRKLGSIDPIKTSNSLAMSDISGKAEGLEKHGPLKAVMNRRCVGRQEQL